MARQHTRKTKSKRNSNQSKNKNTAKKQNLKSRKIKIDIDLTKQQYDHIIDNFDLSEVTAITVRQLKDAFKIPQGE